ARTESSLRGQSSANLALVAQRRERPAQQHGGKAFDFRLSDGRTISVPARDAAPSVGAKLVEAIAARDEAAVAACFAPAVELRALVPRGLRERSGAHEAAALFAARDAPPAHP